MTEKTNLQKSKFSTWLAKYQTKTLHKVLRSHSCSYEYMNTLKQKPNRANDILATLRYQLKFC